MNTPVDVTFDEMFPTDEVMALARRRAAEVEEALGALETCRVIVARASGGRGKRRRYRVIVNLAVNEPSVESTATSEHARLRSAVDGAFRTAFARLRRDLSDRTAA